MIRVIVQEHKCILDRGNTSVELELAELNLIASTIIEDVSERTKIPSKMLLEKYAELLIKENAF